MHDEILRRLGIPRCLPPQPVPCLHEAMQLPDEHPCRGCIVLDTSSGVPHCFLPRCNREIFERLEDYHDRR